MMNNFVIKKIYIENFKLIERFSLSINLLEYDLIMLDGPNGFGKTTLFDAIELLLTGSINRIRVDDGRATFGVDLLRKDINRDCIIKIEFGQRDGQIFTIMKRLKRTARPQRFRVEDFFNFETFLLPHFDATDDQFETIDQERISELFGVSNLSRFFNLFYYIQQEENTHFLKRKSRERMEAIGQLFDTKQEEEEKQKLGNLRSQVRQEIGKINSELKGYKERRSILTDELRGVGADPQKRATFQLLLPFFETPKPWDVERPVLNTRESRDAMVKEIRLISEFVLHFQDFLNGKHNEQIDAAILQKPLIEEAIVTALHLKDFERLKQLNEKEKRLQDLFQRLQREKFTANPSLINFEHVIGDLELSVDVEAIRSIVNEIVIDQKTAGELSKLIRELNEARSQLIKKFLLLTEQHSHVGTDNCPLCGHNWEERDQLLWAIEEKQKHFSSFYDDATHRIEVLFEKLYIQHLQAIIDHIIGYLKHSGNIVNADFFNKVSAAIEKKPRIEKFLQWCDDKQVDVTKYLQTELTIPRDLEDRLNSLVEDIRSKKISILEGQYDVGGERFNEFVTVYKENFGESPERVGKITQGQLEEKISYLEMLYYRGNANELVKVEQAISKLESKVTALSEKDTQLRSIIEEYNAAIKQHWNRIMKDIEIPFYIYSGKIIQYYQKGLGVFIKEAESGEAKSIKFVSDDMSEHDAINYFSSGQISALVISFTLALNKVYGNDGLGLILIDDPVQTMDEINMASLTELLRNEFPQKQIVLSTHEDEVSRYIRYKFQKYGKSTLQLNVKQDLETRANSDN